MIRSRIENSLLSDIKLNIEQIKEAYDYLKKYESKFLIKGTTLNYIDRFRSTENTFYQSHAKELPIYFSYKTLNKISKFYYTFWELQILMEGFVNFLSYLSKNKISLSDNEIERAKNKLLRIYKLCELIQKNQIGSLSNLLENYEGRISPDTMI